ncbi:MAG: ZIP family metal transporter [Acidobacteria bacterium]|nr:ZIP family metal transporter [Acidobacteriota bacterium]
MPTPTIALLLLLTAAAVASAGAGVWMTSVPALSRRVVPFSGGLLVGISLGWVMPELAGQMGWLPGVSWLGAGFALLWVIDRYVHPVCPTCSHTHDHDACMTRLHGFAMPLVIAFALHSFLDGWAVAASADDPNLGLPFVLGLAVHKVPEGLALGVILRAALNSRLGAVAWAAAAQAGTLAGGAVEMALAEHLDRHWMTVLLALAGGSFLYLGAHAVHGEWKRRGGLAFAPALTGFCGAALFLLLHVGH